MGNSPAANLQDQSDALTVSLDQLEPLSRRAKPFARPAPSANSLSVPLDELEPSQPKPSGFDSVYGKPASAPAAQNPFGISSVPAARTTPAAAAARVTEPMVKLSPPENPKPPSDYWVQEYAARQRDIEKINQADEARQRREQEAQERQAETAQQPLETRVVRSMMEPGTTLGTVLRQQLPEEPGLQFESDYFKHRAAEAAAQGKSGWSEFPRSLTETLLRSQNPRMKTEEARRIAEPFTVPLADLPTVTGHTNPFAVGAERAIGGFTSPENLVLLSSLGALEGAAESSTGLLHHAPRIVSGLFATQMGAGLVESARDYQAAKAAGDVETAQRILGSALVQVPLTLLTAYHAGAGRAGAPMRPEELLDSVHAVDTAARLSEAGAIPTPARSAPGAAGGAATHAVSVPLEDLPAPSKLLPEPKAAEYQPLDVTEPTAGKIFYHGTRSPEFTDLREAQPSRSSEGNLLGPGFYMTDSPDVAARYGQRGNLLAGRLGDLHLIDMEANADPRLVSALKEVLPADDFKAVIDKAGDGSGKDLYSAFRNRIIEEHGGGALADYQFDLSHELLTAGADGFRYEGTKLGSTKDNALVLFPDTVNGAPLGEKVAFAGAGADELRAASREKLSSAVAEIEAKVERGEPVTLREAAELGALADHAESLASEHEASEKTESGTAGVGREGIAAGEGSLGPGSAGEPPSTKASLEVPLEQVSAASRSADTRTTTEQHYADAGKRLGLEYRGVMGAEEGLGDKAVVIYQDPESKTSIGVKVGEWSPERMQEKLTEARERMKSDPLAATMYGGLGFLDPELIRRVMPESIKNALSENISEGEREAGIVREKTGELARKKEQVFQHYADAMARWEKRPIQEGREFILREQHGEKQPNAADQAVADQLKKEFAARRQAVEDLSHGSFDHWRENYFPQMWERPNQVADWVKKRILGSRRPLQGPAGFKRARVFDDLQEGLDAGFKPITNNPVSMALLKLHEMDRYIMAHEILGQSRSEGLAKFVRFGEQRPEGWTRVNDSMFRVLQHSEEAKGMVIRGEFYMPAEAAQVLNNYLSPGLRGNPLYDLMRGAGNTLNQAQLGFSAFHAMFSGINSTISDFALALRKASRLNITEAAKASARAVPLIASPIRHVITGTRLMHEYLSPGTYAEYSELADAVAKGGGRIYQDPLYRNASIAKFWKAWDEGDWKQVGLQAFPAALEKMASPVMEHLVPRLKLGTFADMARESLDRLPPGAGKAEIRAALDRAWDSVDNRFGQVVYDNLFVNKVVKDLGLISVRSLGWNLGTVRELGGAAKDTAKAAGRTVFGERPQFTDRMAYTLALPIVTGYIGALVNYAYTGQGPQELKDYFFPRTGRSLANGEPERISLPTYMKDVYAFAKHPLETVGHKAHPLISMIADMLQNKDFYGVEIRHSDDPLVKQVGQLFGYVVSQATPFSLRNLKQRGEAEGRPGVKGMLQEAVSPSGLQSFFGITPAPASVTHTAAEERALEILEHRRPKGTRTSEEYDRQARRAYLRGEVAAGRVQPQDLAQHVRAGEITAKEAGDILKQSREAPIVHYTRSLSLEDFLSVWDLANAKEQAELRPLLISKRHLTANLPADERARMADRLNAAVSGRQEKQESSTSPVAPFISRR